MPISIIEKFLLEGLPMLLSLTGVWLTMRRVVWCWLVNIIASGAYMYLFGRERLYADAALQGLFIVFSLYGWYHWQKGLEIHHAVLLGNAHYQLQGIVFGIVLVFGLCAGWILSCCTNAAIPYTDALLTTFSLGATWLQAKKYLESWLWWVVIDCVYVVVFFSRGLMITAVLYGIFCGLAVIGYRQWKQHQHSTA